MSIHTFKPADLDSPDALKRIRDALAGLSSDELLTLLLAIEKTMQSAPSEHFRHRRRPNANARIRL